MGILLSRASRSLFCDRFPAYRVVPVIYIEFMLKIQWCPWTSTTPWRVIERHLVIRITWQLQNWYSWLVLNIDLYITMHVLKIIYYFIDNHGGTFILIIDKRVTELSIKRLRNNFLVINWNTQKYMIPDILYYYWVMVQESYFITKICLLYPTCWLFFSLQEPVVELCLVVWFTRVDESIECYWYISRPIIYLTQQYYLDLEQGQPFILLFK